jgi:hypothetical protein
MGDPPNHRRQRCHRIRSKARVPLRYGRPSETRCRVRRLIPGEGERFQLGALGYLSRPPATATAIGTATAGAEYTVAIGIGRWRVLMEQSPSDTTIMRADRSCLGPCSYQQQVRRDRAGRPEFTTGYAIVKVENQFAVRARRSGWADNKVTAAGRFIGSTGAYLSTAVHRSAARIPPRSTCGRTWTARKCWAAATMPVGTELP